LWYFRKPALERSRTLTAEDRDAACHCRRRMVVSFQPDRGAPAKITLDRLSSWSQNSDPG